MFGTVIFLQVRSFHFTTLITIKTVHTINNGVYPNSRIQNTDVLHGSSERVRQRAAGQPRPPGPQQAGPALWPAASQGTPSRRGVILAACLASIILVLVHHPMATHYRPGARLSVVAESGRGPAGSTCGPALTLSCYFSGL